MLKKIIPFTLKNLVILYVQHHVKITRRSAAQAGCPVPARSEPRAGINAGGYAQLDLRGLVAPAGSRARTAGFVHHTARALTLRR